MRRAYERASRIAAEMVHSLATVKSVQAEEQMLGEFVAELTESGEALRRSSLIGGIAFGFTQLFMFATWSLAFW